MGTRMEKDLSLPPSPRRELEIAPRLFSARLQPQAEGHHNAGRSDRAHGITFPRFLLLCAWRLHLGAGNPVLLG